MTKIWVHELRHYSIFCNNSGILKFRGLLRKIWWPLVHEHCSLDQDWCSETPNRILLILHLVIEEMNQIFISHPLSLFGPLIFILCMFSETKQKCYQYSFWISSSVMTILTRENINNTLRNISKGASKIVSTSEGFGEGLNALLSMRMPITGTTLRRCWIQTHPVSKLVLHHGRTFESWNLKSKFCTWIIHWIDKISKLAKGTVKRKWQLLEVFMLHLAEAIKIRPISTKKHSPKIQHHFPEIMHRDQSCNQHFYGDILMVELRQSAHQASIFYIFIPWTGMAPW